MYCENLKGLCGQGRRHTAGRIPGKEDEVVNPYTADILAEGLNQPVRPARDALDEAAQHPHPSAILADLR